MKILFYDKKTNKINTAGNGSVRGLVFVVDNTSWVAKGGLKKYTEMYKFQGRRNALIRTLLSPSSCLTSARRLSILQMQMLGYESMFLFTIYFRNLNKLSLYKILVIRF